MATPLTVVLVEGSTSAGNQQPVFAAILDELDTLALGTRPVDDEECWLAKTQLRSAHLLGNQDAYTVMSRLGTQTLYFGRPIEAGRILEEIDRVSADELNQLVREGLRPWLPDLALSWTGPENPRQSGFLDGVRARDLACTA